MFSQSLVAAVTVAAHRAGVRPAALLALVEVETNGVPFEHDGRTPALLYERHVAWREAGKVSATLQAAFARAGLAIPKWSRATQYKDQGASAARLALLARARAIDPEVANLSASWGVGQIMGFHARELGFASATAMVDHMTGNLAGQIDCMLAILRRNGLLAPLAAGDWPKVARLYNGAGYAANRYDTRLADACKRWERRLSGAASAPLAPDMPATDVMTVQTALRDLGYVSVGMPDGVFGTKTVGALSQFQAHEGLAVTGRYDAATAAALRTAEPIDQPRARQSATAGDLADAGSKTVKAAQAGSLLAKVKGVLGASFLAGGLADYQGLFEQAQSGLDAANQAKGVWQSFSDLVRPLVGGPMALIAGVVLVASAVAVALVARCVIAHRLADHRSGVHAGTWGE